MDASIPVSPLTSGSEALSVQLALSRYLGHAPLPFAITRGGSHLVVYANRAFVRLSNYDGKKALGLPVLDAFPAMARAKLLPFLDAALLGHIERELNLEIVDEAGARRTFCCTAWPVVASDGDPEGLGIEIRAVGLGESAVDLQRQVAEHMLLGALRERGLADDAEAARRQAAFLAEAGRLLAESVDHAQTLFALTKLALPSLGSWCIVDLIGTGDAVQRLAIFHPDADKQELAHQLDGLWLPKLDDPFGAYAMLGGAPTISINNGTDEILVAASGSVENLSVLQQMGVGSLLTVPLRARGRLLGAVTFVSATAGGGHSGDDVQLAQDLADRGALALDNAQLYENALLLQQNAEEANRAKSAFLGAMSHELRTPLNAIGGYVELLDMGLRGPVTKEQRADLERVRQNQQQLLVLISEILNYARLGGGQATYNVIDFNACDVLARAVDILGPLVERKNLECKATVDDTTIICRADPEKVTQILVNLVSNAIKFTAAGGRISAFCEATGDDVHFIVTDTGIGIPKIKFEKIFEPFVQLKDSLTEREGGVGLGLAISRDLARAMNGSLAVESTEGTGSSFTLTLPRGSSA